MRGSALLAALAACLTAADRNQTGVVTWEGGGNGDTRATLDSFISQQLIFSNRISDTLNIHYHIISAIHASTSELHASTFTMTSAARVKNCSRSSVFYLDVPDVPNILSCSAFAYHSGSKGDQGTFLVSAAHCFDHHDFTGVTITAHSLVSPPVACTLLFVFQRPSDSALLLCPGAAGTPPLRRRACAADFYLPAATTGFALDTLVSSEYKLPALDKALFIRLSYVGTTLGTHPLYSSPYGTDSLGYHVAGVVEHATVMGMSGGPVLDASCGVLGVNHAYARNAGFASLDLVDLAMI